MTLETTAISRPRAPDLIPGYRLEKLVGKGGMGEVHKAVQLSLGRTVAVKLLSAELAQDKSFVTRFEKEAAALATLSHPHIVAIVDKGKSDKTYFLVMEFVDGPSLREVMRSPLFDATSALKIATEICRAIDYAHGRGVIHRDLKPENILFDEQAGGIPKVSDFGLASFVDDGPTKFNVTETHVSMGTLSYMAPEQRVDAKSADHRADIFSLGVILYEMLTGEVPMGHFDPPSHKKPDLDKRLDAIVAKCLKPVPADRYQKVSELLSDLEPMAPVSFSQLPHKASKLDRAKIAARRALRTTARVVEAAVVVAALGNLGLSWLRSRAPAPPLEISDVLTNDLGPSTGLTPSARITDGADGRSVLLGEGPDAVPLQTSGRGIKVNGRAVTFAPPDSQLRAGRAILDLSETDGHQVGVAAEVSTTTGEPGWWSRTRAWFRGVQPQSRSAVALQGVSGRYAAVVLDGTGGPSQLEWAFGERRGTMLGPVAPAQTRVELEVDKSGELRAFLGTGKDRRPLGEPISLGKDWRKHFGKMPTPEFACIDGACEVKRVEYAVRREPAPAPQPVAEEPAQAAVKNPVKLASAQAKKAPTPVKKPAPKPAPAKKPAHRR